MVALTDHQVATMAKARVTFKMHAILYVCVNLFLVAIYYVASNGDPVLTDGGQGASYWPIWAHLGWGLGLAIHGITTYGPLPSLLQQEEDSVRRQYGKD